MKKNLLFFLILVVGCNKVANQEKPLQKSRPVNEMENFETFYKRFLTDSAFQVSRVKFPLPAFYVDNDVADINYKGDTMWTKNTYRVLREPSEEDQKFISQGKQQKKDSVFITLTSDEFGFYMQLRFARVKSEWYLVYLDDRSM